MSKVKRQARQGDVLLHPVKEVPAGATLIPDDGQDIILAEGEVTGHAHRIRKPGKKIKRHMHEGVLYLEVLEPVTVDHEEHGPSPMEAGQVYQVRRQVEEWLNEVRQVKD